MDRPSEALRARREAVVRRHIDAENAGDVDRWIASFHRPRYDVVAMGAVGEGEAAVRQLVGGLATAFPDLRLTPSAIHHETVYFDFGALQRQLASA